MKNKSGLNLRGICRDLVTLLLSRRDLPGWVRSTDFRNRFHQTAQSQTFPLVRQLNLLKVPVVQTGGHRSQVLREEPASVTINEESECGPRSKYLCETI